MTTQTQTQIDREFLGQIGAKLDGFEFTIGELRSAFDRIVRENAVSQNWKDRIRTNIIFVNTDREHALIRAAVTFMTGSVATLTAFGRWEYRVEAAGYYAAVGA